MNTKDRIHGLIKEISSEILRFIREHESPSNDRWVPASQIKNDLELNFVAVPRTNQQQGQRGWFFATIARLLEDQNLIECEKSANGRLHYRTKG